MGIQTIPAPSASIPSENWVLISQTNPGATTLNLTGISGYKKLRFGWFNVSGATALSVIRFNNDTTSKYHSFGTKSNTAAGYTVVTPNNIVNNLIGITPTATTCDVLIEQADTSTMKIITLNINDATNQWLLTGKYLASAPISQINFTWGTAFAADVYLWGVLA